jgi:hypothetical protein
VTWCNQAKSINLLCSCWVRWWPLPASTCLSPDCIYLCHVTWCNRSKGVNLLCSCWVRWWPVPASTCLSPNCIYLCHVTWCNRAKGLNLLCSCWVRLWPLPASTYLSASGWWLWRPASLPSPGSALPREVIILDSKHDANPGLWIRIWIRINMNCWIRIQIREGKNDPQI